MVSSKFLLASFAVIGIIVHGSLFPYDFQVPLSSQGAISALLKSWATPPASYGDLVANVLLYIPFGFCGMLSIGGKWGARLFIVAGGGLILSTSIEIAQFYDVGRVPNMSDVYLNTFGAIGGGLAALLFGFGVQNPVIGELAAQPMPAMLLAGMLGYHLFRYVPTIDAHKYWESLKPILLSPSLSVQASVRYLAMWLTSSWPICEIVGFRRARIFVPLFTAFVFLSKVSIENLVVTVPEVLGAGFAMMIWLVLGHYGRVATLFTAAVLCGSVVAGRLEPFEFLSADRAFEWLPFRGFLDGSVSVNAMAFMEKFFLYGSLIWLLSRSGLPLWMSAFGVAALLFACSWAELYLPGRSAEITDAFIAIMIGLVMGAIRSASIVDRVYRDRFAPQTTGPNQVSD